MAISPAMPQGAARWVLVGVLLVSALLYTLPVKGSVLQTDQIIQAEASDRYRIQWVLGIEGVAGLVSVFTSIRLVDEFGRRRIYLIGLFCLALGSLGTSLARATWYAAPVGAVRNLSPLFLIPGLTMIQELLPRRRGVSSCIYLAMVYGGQVLAEPLGSLVAYHPSWRLLFGGTSFASWLMLALALALFPAEPRPKRPDKPFDWPGMVLFAAWLSLILFLLYRGNYLGWLVSAPITAAILGLVLITAMLIGRLLAAPEPFIHLGGFAYRTVGLAMVTAACWSASLFGVSVQFANYLLARGYEDWKAGWVLLPMGLVVMAGMIAWSFVKTRRRLVRMVQVGLAGMTAMVFLGLSQVDSYMSWQRLMGMTVVWGLFAGLCLPPLSRLMMEGQGPEALRATGAMKFLMRAWGGTLGILIANVLLVQGAAWGHEYLRVSVTLGQGALETVMPQIEDHMVRHGSAAPAAVAQAQAYLDQWVFLQARVIGFRQAIGFCGFLSLAGLILSLFLGTRKEWSIYDGDD